MCFPSACLLSPRTPSHTPPHLLLWSVSVGNEAGIGPPACSNAVTTTCKALPAMPWSPVFCFFLCAVGRTVSSISQRYTTHIPSSVGYRLQGVVWFVFLSKHCICCGYPRGPKPPSPFPPPPPLVSAMAHMQLMHLPSCQPPTWIGTAAPPGQPLSCSWSLPQPCVPWCARRW